MENENMLPFPLITSEDDGTKVIEAEYHTLFVKEQDAELIERQIMLDNEEVTILMEQAPKHKIYTLYIETFGHQKNTLHKILHELRKGVAEDELIIRIDSGGGFVSECITLYNAMRELFGGRVTTYVDSTGFSAGAMLFSLGDMRVAYADSSLMYHNYSTGAGGKGGEIKSYIEFEDKHFDHFFKEKIVDKGFLTAEEYKEMKIGRDFWFGSYEMAKRGISTHTIVDGFRLDADAFIEYYEQDLPIGKWAISKMEQMLLEEEENKPVYNKDGSISKKWLKEQEKKDGKDSN